MEHLLKALKEKNLVDDENHCVLDYNFGDTMAQRNIQESSERMQQWYQNMHDNTQMN